jgi:hypothetical protein
MEKPSRRSLLLLPVRIRIFRGKLLGEPGNRRFEGDLLRQPELELLTTKATEPRAQPELEDQSVSVEQLCAGDTSPVRRRLGRLFRRQCHLGTQVPVQEPFEWTSLRSQGH